jgi:non-lysosomal glucosylceramidase
MTIKPPFTYPGDHLSKISFPLGGIGTSSIGLSGARLLINWEVFNRPAKGIGNVLSYFAIKAEVAIRC